MQFQAITKNILKERLDRGELIQMVDVRAKNSFLNGHIRGARSVPFDDFIDRATEALNPGECTVLYGEDEKDVLPDRSAALLIERGFDANDLFILREGLVEWRAAGYFLESGDEPIRG